MQNILHEAFQGFGQWLKTIGIEVAFIIAGVFGGIVNISKETKMNFWQKTISIISGGAAANYLTPVFVSFLNINDNTKFGIAFVIGYMGLRSIELLIVRIKKGVDNAKSEIE